jgi:hypothetical protein
LAISAVFPLKQLYSFCRKNYLRKRKSKHLERGTQAGTAKPKRGRIKMQESQQLGKKKTKKQKTKQKKNILYELSGNEAGAGETVP